MINKIDLPAADPELVRKEIEELLIMEGSEAILASAKEGIGIDDILEAIVTRIPSPRGREDYLRGLVFNAQFDPYRGVVAYVRIADGNLKSGTRIMSMARIVATSESVPAERVAALRRAFDQTMKDPEFTADAERQQFDLIYTF